MDSKFLSAFESVDGPLFNGVRLIGSGHKNCAIWGAKFMAEEIAIHLELYLHKEGILVSDVIRDIRQLANEIGQ